MKRVVAINGHVSSPRENRGDLKITFMLVHENENIFYCVACTESCEKRK